MILFYKGVNFPIVSKICLFSLWSISPAYLDCLAYVSVAPNDTAFTLTPKLANSNADHWTKELSMALLTENSQAPS